MMKELVWILIMQLQTMDYAGSNTIATVEFYSAETCDAARARWMNMQQTYMTDPPIGEGKRVYRYGLPTAICVKK